MSNISVTTTQSVIEVTQTGGITVTTPEGQTIAVTVPNSSVNVTNTTDDITITEVGITNTDQLIEGTTNLFFTNARARSAISLNTDDTSILDYNSTTGVFTWDTPTTTKIAEGTNLYYTTARANTDFDTRLATKTTTNLAEGTNQYFTTARARQSLSAGTGISYDNATGVITNTSINTDTTYTIDASTATGGANLNLVGSDSSTDTVKIASGTNITVSRTDANTITIDGSDLNTTYTISSASTTGGANLTLTGSDSSTDSVAYKGSGATTVTSTDANTITITSTDTNTTYTQNASTVSGGANLNLVGSDSTTDSVKFAGSGATTITRTDADTITVSSTDTNTTYTVDATATTGGANLNLTGSDSSTDSVKFAGSGATTITRTDANTITVSSTDTNTTYSQNFSSVSGGTNLNLVGSDATTDTVKFANGTGVTVTRTDADTATIAIGQAVATTDSPTFNNLTLTGGGVTNTTTNGNVTLTPNGTGDVVLSLSNGGNLTNNRNYVFGAIRNSTTDSIGDIWALNTTGTVQPFRGISIDNSADTTKLPGLVIRSYNSTNTNRGRIIFERARGTAASPTAVQSGDFLGEFAVSGCNGAGTWLNDSISVVPGFFGFTASENWSSNTNLGTNFSLSLAPTATTISTGTNLVPCLAIRPETSVLKGDQFAISQAKTLAFVATGCSTSGSTLTIGTVTSGTPAVGQLVQSSITSFFNATYIVSNVSGSGSGSVWNVSSTPGTQSGLTITGQTAFIGSPIAATTVDALQDLRLLKNVIKGSGGNNAITLTSANTQTIINGDQFNVNNAAGTNYFRLEKDNANHIVASVNQLRATTADEFAIVNFTTQRSTDGINYTPTQSGDVIGSFKFNGNANTSTSPGVPAGPGAQITATATENWTTGANGTKFSFSTIKTGTTTGLTIIEGSSGSTIFRSDQFTFQNSSSTNITGNNINYNRVYGAFQYNTTVTPAAANTAYVFPIGTVDFSNIVSVGSTSRIILGAAGIYNLQFSVQVENTTNAAEHIAYIWLRKNGVDIAGSTGRVTLAKSASTISGWNYVIDSANTTDYYEIAYAVNDTAVIFPTYAATAFGPSTASLITTVTPIGA
jgi:hypothetical protein